MRTRWLERLRAEPRTIAAEVSAAPRGRVVAEALLVAAVFGLGLLPAVSLTWLWPSLLFSSLLAAVLVLFRLRRPGLAFAACSLLLVFGQLSVLPAATVLSFHAGRRVRPLWRLWLLTAFVLVVGILPEWPPDEGTLLGYLAVNAAMIVVPVLAGQLIGTRRPLARVLHDRNAYLAQVRELTAAEARGAERAHIAAEMHDLLGHRLALLSMHAGALEVATRKQAPRLSEQAQLLRTTAGTAMAELRDILGVLRVGESAELDEDTGTTADLARLVAESRRVGMDVELDWQGPDLSEVDVRVRRAVHRLVREGLTNAHKHAPRAAVRVEVRTGPAWLRVVVRNGPHPASGPPGTRRGLAGLEERVSLAGGRFAGGRTVDGGFDIRADLPMLPPAAPAPAAPPELPPPPGPLAAEVLTVPRVIGSGCLVTVAVTPLLGLLLVFLVLSVQGWRDTMSRTDYEALAPGTPMSELRERYGGGLELSLLDPDAPKDNTECTFYRAEDDPGTTRYRLCHREDRLVHKDRVR